MKPYYHIDLPASESFVNNVGRLQITAKSPIKHRRTLEQFARYFKREMHYDFVQYLASEDQCHPDHIPYCGWLFTGTLRRLVDDILDSQRAIGGCCFRLRKLSNEHKWYLDWIWFHPFWRSRGQLSKHWRFFRQEYGDFAIEYPISPAMDRFLKKQESQNIVAADAGT
jgi:hypothetical protein